MVWEMQYWCVTIGPPSRLQSPAVQDAALLFDSWSTFGVRDAVGSAFPRSWLFMAEFVRKANTHESIVSSQLQVGHGTCDGAL